MKNAFSKNDATIHHGMELGMLTERQERKSVYENHFPLKDKHQRQSDFLSLVALRDLGNCYQGPIINSAPFIISGKRGREGFRAGLSARGRV